jgi:hypothetical protein
MQTVDLRKKNFLEPPRPAPREEHVAPKEPIAEPVVTELADTISWSTQLHHAPQKGASLYVGGVLFGAAVLVGFFWHDLLFTAVLAVMAVLFILRAFHAPHRSQVHIDKTGIAIDGQKYFYHEVGSFWLDYEPPHTKELSVHFKKISHTPLRIPLEHIDPLEIRGIMVEFIPEKEHARPLLEIFVRSLGL